MTRDRFLDAVPTPGIFIALAVGFTAGALIGIAWDRRYHRTPTDPSRDAPEDTMNERPLGMVWLENRPRLHALYMRYISVVVAALFLIVASSAFGVVWLTFTRGNDNQQNAIVNCQNANESRSASNALWNFLFETAAKSPVATPTQRENYTAVLVWVGKLYAPHDCNDLARKYPIPPPPVIRPVR